MQSSMLFKQLFPDYSSAESTEYIKRQRQVKYSNPWSLCRVCGDKASIINYGALSCQSCKTFFRRNGPHSRRIRPCSWYDSCKINVALRRNCTACRLAKCFSIGMSTHLIRKEEKKVMEYSSQRSKSQSISITESQIYTVEALLLNSEEKKLLSNVIYALDIHSPISKIRVIIKNLSSPIFDAPFNVINIAEIALLIHKSIRSFISSIPDFQVLTASEQCSFIDRNFDGIANLYSVVVFRDVGLLNKPYCIKSFASVYGVEMMQKIVHADKQIKIGLTIIKLMLPILAFSSNCSIIDYQGKTHSDSLLFGTYRLLGSQDVYVDILWKYLICKYGYYKSAYYFTRLVKLSLDLMKYSTYANINNTIYRDLLYNYRQETKQALINNQNEFVPLWGII